MGKKIHVATILGSKICLSTGFTCRLEKYLKIQVCLEKSLKIEFALKST